MLFILQMTIAVMEDWERGYAQYRTRGIVNYMYMYSQYVLGYCFEHDQSDCSTDVGG